MIRTGPVLLIFLGLCQAKHITYKLHRRPVQGLNAARTWRGALTATDRRRVLYKDIAKVHKESDGVYFTTICMGVSNAQCFTVIVDTGSSTIAVPCKGCNCGSQHSYYDKKQSTTVVDNGQTYSQCYGEGSCNRGKLLTDTICFGKGCQAETGVAHPFGCCSEFSPNFRTQDADGIIGVSPSGRTLWKDLAAHHKLDDNQLAICFGTKEGEMTVGGWDHTIPGVGNQTAASSLQWTNMKTSDNFYRVVISHATVGEAEGKLQVSGFAAISPMVDCGSTFSFMQKTNWNKLRSGLIEYCGKDASTRCQSEAGRNPGGDESGDADLSLGCYKFSTDRTTRMAQLSTFPSITFKYQKSDGQAGEMLSMCVPAEQYFFLSGAAANVYCGGIFKDAQNVIGANLLANFLVVFKNDRMGLARAQCDRASGGESGESGSSSSTTPVPSIGMGPCGSPDDGTPSSSTGNLMGLTTFQLIMAAIGGVFATVVGCFVLSTCIRCCRAMYQRWCGVKYTPLDDDEEAVALGTENSVGRSEMGKGNGAGGSGGAGGGVKGGDFEIELTDQEKKRTEELVKAADAMFLAVEKGADPEDAGVEFDGEDCI
jgi:hypothetical protein